MGFFNRISGIFRRSGFRRRAPRAEDFFRMFQGYTPVFTSAPESLYEMELIRAAIHSFASFCSLLKPEIKGTALEHMERHWQMSINPFMDTSKFLYRLATILSVDNNAFIIPLEGRNGQIAGFYPLMPMNSVIVEHEGVLWLRYLFPNGQYAAIEFDRVGIITQHHYRNEIFGESNSTLKPTIQLLHTNNEGIVTGIKNSANIRFLMRINQMLHPDDIRIERERFSEENLSADNKSGVLMYDLKFDDVKQIENKPYNINAAQMKEIAQNVFNYFGTNESILQNSYNEEGFNAYFEGKIAPWANQLSLVLTNMIFSRREIAHGNEIILTVNRLQYLSHKTKLDLSTAGFDRGLLTRNEIRKMWGQPQVEDEDGDIFFIRKEYTRMEDLGKEIKANANSAGQGVQGNDNTHDSGTGGAHTAI